MVETANYSTELLEALDAIRQSCEDNGYIWQSIDDLVDYTHMRHGPLTDVLEDAAKIGLVMKSGTGFRWCLTPKGEEVAHEA